MEELADLMVYCILMADALNVDIDCIVSDKMAWNNIKYPVEKSYGNAKKYNELTE